MGKNLLEVKDDILRYLEYDYSTQEMFLELYNKSYFNVITSKGGIILQSKRPIPSCMVNDYKLFGYDDVNLYEFANNLNPNDFIFAYWNCITIPDSLILLNKEKYLCMKTTEIFDDNSVFKLTITENTEVIDFLNISEKCEIQINDENEAISVIQTIRTLWHDETEEKDSRLSHYCIRNEGNIIGISEVRVNNIIKNKALLSNIYVLPNYRGKKFGKRLLLASMREKNYTYFYNCHDNNYQSYYTALSVGYHDAGIVYVFIKK